MPGTEISQVRRLFAEVVVCLVLGALPASVLACGSPPFVGKTWKEAHERGTYFPDVKATVTSENADGSFNVAVTVSTGSTGGSVSTPGGQSASVGANGTVTINVVIPPGANSAQIKFSPDGASPETKTLIRDKFGD